MSKMPNQKLKLIQLMNILLNNTDDEHPMTTSELISELNQLGISAERKSLYDDIECLRSIGLDIEMKRCPVQAYFIANGTFQLPELKILADIVAASKFITDKKSRELIKKLGTLTSTYQSAKIERQVYVSNRPKSTNETIYYTVDLIHNSIAEMKKITFQYFDYNEKKEKIFHHGGMFYTASPFALLYNNENYYLVAKCDQHEKTVSHFRADKMCNVTILDEKRIKCTYDMSNYTSRVFDMFGGEELSVRFLCENSLAGVIIDRFGKKTEFIPEDENHFSVCITAQISPVFWGWVFQFGEKIKIIAPQTLAEEYIQRLEKVYNKYD